jgi:hypothetical protein
MLARVSTPLRKRNPIGQQHCLQANDDFTVLLFAKTDTSRQTELVTVLARLA